MTISVNMASYLNRPQVGAFKLRRSLILEYENKDPNFGFNGLGEFVYMRSYSRVKEDGTKERWYDTVRRVVEGTYTIQKKHIKQNGLHWDEAKAQKSASTMFKYMFEMKFLPPGRGLWAMGTDIINVKGLFGALNNCAFTSTEHIDEDFLEPFSFMMDASMLGAGVGFDVKGAGKRIIHKPYEDGHLTPPASLQKPIVVSDDREGWVEALEALLQSYTQPLQRKVLFEYHLIREKGEPLKTFGGYASGYEALETLIERIRAILDPLHKQPITETAIADIMNMIGKCVYAGGIRRTAQIAFGNSQEFLDLKNWEVNSQRSDWMNASNNSILAEVGEDYSKYYDNLAINGEPGFFWLQNARDYGRMGRNVDEFYGVDCRVCGGNPCLEQSLEHMEMCCLVETFPNKCEDITEYMDVLKFAYLYAKTVTLGRTTWEKTNEVMLRNRRIGTSVSGIAQFLDKHGLGVLQQYLDQGYKYIRELDTIYSDWFKVPRSIKVTSVKPSGTVSLLAGATAGIHYPVSRYYKRHVRIANHDPIYEYAQRKGLKIEPEWIRKNGKNDEVIWSKSETESVVAFDIDSEVTSTKNSMWQQLELASFFQEWWADNQVSVTVTFNPETEGEEWVRAMEHFQYKLKGVSFLPQRDLDGEYRQLPYQTLTEDEYYGRNIIGYIATPAGGTPIATWDDIEWGQPEADKGCNTDICLT